MTLLASWAFVLAIVRYAQADTNGMDMSMDGAMSMASGTMRPYLHFTLGDILWFQGWVPQTAGSMVGACIGLFLLALVERWISATRSVMEVHWRKRAQIIMANKLNAQRPLLHTRALSSSSGMEKEKDKGRESAVEEVEELSSTTAHKSTSTRSVRNIVRTVPPFIPSHDIPRGLIYGVQVVLEFAFMLAIMTYQAGFIFSIVIGLGLGETLFGRYNQQAHLHY